MSHEAKQNQKLFNELTNQLGIAPKMVPAYQAIMVDEDEPGELILVNRLNKTIAIGYDCTGFVVEQANNSDDITDEEMDIIYGGEYEDQQLTLKQTISGVSKWLK